MDWRKFIELARNRWKKHPGPEAVLYIAVVLVVFLAGVVIAKVIDIDLGKLARYLQDHMNLSFMTSSFQWKLWYLVLLILGVAGVVGMIIVLAMRHFSSRRVTNLKQALEKSKGKNQQFEAEAESHKSEAREAMQSANNSQQALKNLQEMAIAIQETSAILIADAQVSQRVVDSFLFRPQQVETHIEERSSVKALLEDIRHWYYTGVETLDTQSSAVLVLSGLLNDDKLLAEQLMDLMSRSIDRQFAHEPESMTPELIEQQVRRRLREALSTFKTDLEMAELKLGDGHQLDSVLGVLKGRLNAAKKVAESNEKTMEALRRLLQMALAVTFPLLHADRGLIFVPDNTGQYLVRCAATHLDNREQDHPSRYYIGTDRNKIAERGVAGYAFTGSDLDAQPEPVACHWDAVRGVYVDKYSAAARYRHGVTYTKSDPPDYQSFIAIPLYEPLLRGPDANPSSRAIEGVVCFDAHEPTLFQNHDILNPATAYQHYSFPLIRVIFELVEWRRKARAQAQNYASR